jgi:calcineurin-like phosphoesterase
MERYYKQTPVRFEAATTGSQLHASVVRVDPETGKASSIERVRRDS